MSEGLSGGDTGNFVGSASLRSRLSVSGCQAPMVPQCGPALMHDTLALDVYAHLADRICLAPKNASPKGRGARTRAEQL